MRRGINPCEDKVMFSLFVQQSKKNSGLNSDSANFDRVDGEIGNQQVEEGALVSERSDDFLSAR